MCFSRGTSPGEALAVLSLRTRRYLDWLAEFEPVPDIEGEFAVVEEVPDPHGPVKRGGTRAPFAWDRHAPTKGEFDHDLRWMAHHRRRIFLRKPWTEKRMGRTSTLFAPQASAAFSVTSPGRSTGTSRESSPRSSSPRRSSMTYSLRCPGSAPRLSSSCISCPPQPRRGGGSASDDAARRSGCDGHGVRDSAYAKRPDFLPMQRE